MISSRLPGSRWLTWVRNRTLRVGVLTGVYLSMVMVVSVLAANRLPSLEDYANIRNWVARVLFVLVMLIPVGCFLRSPARLCAAGVSGWFLFTLAYALIGWFFENLHSRLGKTPFHAFMLGAVIYGVISVAAWVVSMGMEALHHSIAAPRRRPH